VEPPNVTATSTPTVRQLVLDLAASDALAAVVDDTRVTYRDWVAGSVAAANALLARRTDGPFHVGVLLDNGPEFSTALAAAAIAGATVVGLNPTRRGAEMVRDVTHTDCQIILTEASHAELVSSLGIEMPIVIMDRQDWADEVDAFVGAPPSEIDLDPAAPYLLLFTSGTTGDPKAAICSQARLARIGLILRDVYQLTPADVCYQAMPMFHSNALMAGWAPCIAAGSTAAFRRRFSASGFLPDVRRYGVTYFNYVGKPLTYILATPELPDDAENTLRVVFGNEGAPHDLARFEVRFGVGVTDSYGSTEGGVAIGRTPDTPPTALGRGDASVKILDRATGEECPRAVFDATGKLVNGEAAIGEIVSMSSAPTFEGYYNNPDADRERTDGGIYWSGDLGYMDETGLIYFAGRNYDWLRVDGENFAAAPVERILVRHPDVDLAAVYAVPNSDVGDDVMATLVRRPDAGFDGLGFLAFLRDQPDMGTKWLPRYVRWGDVVPQTATNKILKRELRNQRWEAPDAEVWLLDGESYRPLTANDVAAIRERFVARGRVAELDR
jgi:fatty-acyl-CoA synthase